ncbi:LysR substrate-binding domain-containing protein [Shewanella schlegeliana]|uniref:LysR family transcriptional regulator n=1 Tax=Shewanella schlegeliana TaxID=190308 RepID=A0ABS1T3W0_9GAMM|nr:LysR family transcriptional regulator [Shewanella schlegeliana]MBL4914839.1 LysR family transcriptional regulator [Shewanella schlegeliana]MCL1110470.1 LysR substrate-binding domain-containing protein [Shewanella schlegeliana]GIU27523.1 transcriptional regulator [Shewanella schlegeliana]
MNPTDLKIIQQCDLNLLLSLAILIEEQSVSKSADRLDISQPAMSQNLKKLRNMFDDPLFVKQGQGIRATKKALRLYGSLTEWLQMSDRLISQTAFDPMESHGVIRIAFMDDLTQTMIPMMLDRILTFAPNVELEFVHKPRDVFSLLESGEIDIAAAGTDTPPANIHGRHISTDNYCAAYSLKHPLAKIAQPTLAQIFAHDTAEYSASNLVELEITQLALQHQLQRKMTFSTGSFLVLLQGLLAGKHVGFLPQRVLNSEKWRSQLKGVVLTELPQLDSTLYWHARVHKDPLIQWFKDQCLDIVSQQQLQRGEAKSTG